MSLNVREIITIQVGHYANFVGTHWWNLQEGSFVFDETKATDINHDFLFREGITPYRQETYTPRVLAIDAKGSLCTLSESGSLYEPRKDEPAVSEAAWDGPVNLIQQVSSEKNEFLHDLEELDAQYLKTTDEDKDICADEDADMSSKDQLPVASKIYDLSNSVSVWSDFLRPHLHQKSILQLDNVWLHDAESDAWGFPAGYAEAKREQTEEEITDRIRMLAEGCGSLQGFYMLADIHNGMGGVSWGIMEHLADEFASKDSFTFTLTPPQFLPSSPQANLSYLSSVIQSITELGSLTTVLVPLNLHKHIWRQTAESTVWPHLRYQVAVPYESSSIMAAFLDTVTLVSRHRSAPFSLACVGELLTPVNRKIVAGSVALPLGMSADESLTDWLQLHGPQLISLSGGCDFHLNPISECQVIRGVPQTKLRRSDSKLMLGLNSWNIYEQHLQENCCLPRAKLISGARDPLTTAAPFPHIFSKDVDQSGFLNCVSTTTPTAVTSVPAVAALHQGAGVTKLLHQLLDSARGLNVAKVPRLLEEGIDSETWNNIVEELKTMVENYGKLQCSSGDESDFNEDIDE